ncbi:protein phosphatase Slingshot isoform X3 [Cimex lectularius]|uniref:protein-serine/threonine phosphatase n=1 Tax=Cimex lectularius TaxID=79782 RepID=A0A8I6R6Z4_CIMLE|nr:protein phosphatase Slingshot isoform X3 [Cimex lectularius]
MREGSMHQGVYEYGRTLWRGLKGGGRVGVAGCGEGPIMGTQRVAPSVRWQARPPAHDPSPWFIIPVSVVPPPPVMLYILPPPPPTTGAGIWSPVSDHHTWISNAKPRVRNSRNQVSDPFFQPDSGAGGSLDEEDTTKNGRSLSECYFAGKGAAVVLPPYERLPPSPHASATAAAAAPATPAPGSDIQCHLQSMFYLLRPEETLKMAVKLESVHPGRTRYLVVVSRMGRQLTEESCLLGIDCNHTTTVGLVLKVLANTSITLDGDGGFSVSVCEKHHIFKPVSVQAMWSALQTLHKVSGKAREHNYFLGGVTHDWVAHYEGCISSDRSCLNEWNAMDSLESRRPPSPDSVRHKPTEREETEKVIRTALKEIMMSVDLDEVTSKQVRTKLEESLDVDLGEFKSFIDQEMLIILGQMDKATEIFPHVYLGSEWNASNLEELNKNGVCHILNVTREIDNFFPGMFDYLNVRVYDDEKTDLLKHWDNTFKYITKAKKAGSKVLVHCKMGVSRSASVVIAYAMKAYSWDLKKALNFVQKKRQCIKPNSSFISQLETYQGILDAMKNKEKLQRSKSETNLKCKPNRVHKIECNIENGRSVSEGESERESEEERLPPLHGIRPKSWSPDHVTANSMFTHPQNSSKLSVRKETGDVKETERTESPAPTPPPPPPLPPLPVPEARNYNINVRMPCGNGLAYSVSQNKILHLPCSQSQENGVSSVKHRVSTLELQSGRHHMDRKGLVLNLTSQFEEDKTEPKKDVFSSQLDRVFDREENVNHEVSRQSSWSSFDSGMTGGEGVSRQSSWGSGDTKSIIASRNSSWGSYDMRTQVEVKPPEVGKVKNLKKEFEAKSGAVKSEREENSDLVQSLPSSPISDRCERPSPSGSLEELSVRKLVGRYERPPQVPPPRTSRPPIIPIIKSQPMPRNVVASVLTKAAHKKQQQGKTHPLARLTRLNNPVYNTM